MLSFQEFNMKKTFITGLLFCSIVPFVSAADTIIIGAKDDLCPHSGVVDIKPKGIAIDIIWEAFKKAGVEVNFHSIPYVRCMEEAKVGKIFGCFDTVRNSTLENQYLWHSSPLFIGKINIYAKSDSAEKGLSTKNPNGKEEAVTKDYEYGEVFDTNTKISAWCQSTNCKDFVSSS
jgi:polar amino acid transport system substrate-binding protein